MKRRKTGKRRQRKRDATCPYTGSKTMPAMAKSIDSRTGIKPKMPKKAAYRPKKITTGKWW